MTRESIWTRDKDRELALRYQAGEAVGGIAAAFGLPVTTIRGRVSALGLLRRKLRGEEKPDGGNAAWVLGAALRTGMAAPTDPFATDLMRQLDDTLAQGSARKA